MSHFASTNENEQGERERETTVGRGDRRANGRARRRAPFRGSSPNKLPIPTVFGGASGRSDNSVMFCRDGGGGGGPEEGERNEGGGGGGVGRLLPPSRGRLGHNIPETVGLPVS